MKTSYTFFMPANAFQIVQKDPASALVTFAENGDMAGVLRALLAGAEVNAGQNEIKGSAVTRAAQIGFLDIVKKLASKKADINLRNYNGRNALHEAVSNGETQTALFLLEQNSIMAVRDRRGNTVMDAAIEMGLKKVALRMIEKRLRYRGKKCAGRRYARPYLPRILGRRWVEAGCRGD